MTTESGGNQVDAYIAFGSNLGDRLGNMRAAFEMLVAHDCVTLMAQSSLYETAPIGGPPGQSAYLNGVVAVQTTLAPEELLAHCLKIESELGRVRKETCGPRTIDLDLLLYGDRVVQTDNLVVPHPRMHLRDFVLVPLVEIGPKLMHPVLRCSIRNLAERMPRGKGDVRRAYNVDWSTPSA